MTDVNIPLLRKTVEWAEAEAAKPREIREWEQTNWVVDPASVDEFRDPATLVIVPGYEDRIGTEDEDAYLMEEPYQKSTDCGTCYCIAGYAASITLREGESLNGAAVMKDGEIVCAVPDRAAEELGIDMVGFDYSLFAASNSIQEIRSIAEEIAGERL